METSFILEEIWHLNYPLQFTVIIPLSLELQITLKKQFPQLIKMWYILIAEKFVQKQFIDH